MARHQDRWRPCPSEAKAAFLSSVFIIGLALIAGFLLLEWDTSPLPLPRGCQQYDTLIRDGVMYGCFSNGNWKRIESGD